MWAHGLGATGNTGSLDAPFHERPSPRKGRAMRGRAAMGTREDSRARGHGCNLLSARLTLTPCARVVALKEVEMNERFIPGFDPVRPVRPVALAHYPTISAVRAHEGRRAAQARKVGRDTVVSTRQDNARERKRPRHVDAAAAERRERDCYRNEVVASVAAGLSLALWLSLAWCIYGLWVQ